MPVHDTAIVPIESWCYNSPEMFANGKLIDVGLFCEALLYYEKVLLHVTTQHQFAKLIEWTLASGHYDDFLTLFIEGTVSMYDYSFYTGPVEDDGVIILANIEDPVQKSPNSFARRYISHKSLDTILPIGPKRSQLDEALRGRVLEVKMSDFGRSSANRNAEADIADPRRCALIVQAFVDEVYRYRRTKHPPKIEAKRVAGDPSGQFSISWNIEFADINKLAGASLNFRGASTIAGAASCNRYLWSAAELGVDLYLSSPMATLVGDKLYEAIGAPTHRGQLIQQLKEGVDFPDVRRLCNNGILNLGDILSIRRKAFSFRQWLQCETERDRSAILAYHHEVAKSTGLLGLGRKSLNMFGVVAGGALGAGLGQTLGGVTGAAIGGGVGAGFTFLTEIGAHFRSGWRPSVFGSWLEDRIKMHRLTG